MENNEKMMSGEESLRVITEMINKTKVNIQQSSFHLLFWGWLIFACSLLEYLLGRFSDFAHPYYIWVLVVPGAIVSMVYGFVTGRKTKVQTYADRLYMWTWIGFMITATVLFIVQWERMDLLVPYILLLAGFPTFISGIILRFKPLVAGGIIFWVIAVIVSFTGPLIAPLGMPLAMITGYLIPGYLLKNRTEHDTI